MRLLAGAMAGLIAASAVAISALVLTGDPLPAAAEVMSFVPEASCTRITQQAESLETYESALIGMGVANPLLGVVGSWERRANLNRLKRVLEDASGA